MVKIIECEQNTPEWYSARIGRVTASNMDRIITPTGEKSDQATKYINQLIGEQITGQSGDAFKGNPHSDRGKEFEQEAAGWYAMNYEVELTKIGFCTTDDGLVGCSPDYFIGDDEMLEIKTGIPSVMIELYLNDKLEQKHRPQTQCGLYVTGRRKITTLLYHPLMKPIIISAERNVPYIISMETMLGDFHMKMQDRITLLRNKGYMEAAA